MRPVHAKWTGFAGKTLWDWLQLLVIPMALAIGGFFLNYFQGVRDQQREDARARLERNLSADRARQDVLRTYLQQMSDLLLTRGLRTSHTGSEVQSVARSLTLTALRRLDPEGKGFVVRFLADAHLLQRNLETFVVESGGGRRHRVRARTDPKVQLDNADLRGARLDAVSLYGAQFAGADLRNAHFRNAALYGSHFEDADLRHADFRGADFVGGTLTERGHPPRLAFGRASLEGACVTDTSFNRARLRLANFDVVGRDVDLSHADLAGARMRFAALRDVSLVGTKMKGARLPKDWTGTGARISRARVDFLCVIPPTGYNPAELPP